LCGKIAFSAADVQPSIAVANETGDERFVDVRGQEILVPPAPGQQALFLLWPAVLLNPEGLQFFDVGKILWGMSPRTACK
jgi:hypothetical protein